MTIEQYREKHPPEETLLYIGTKNVDVAALKAVFEDFREWLKEKCNKPTYGRDNVAYTVSQNIPVHR